MSEVKKYKLQKGLPGFEAGTVFDKSSLDSHNRAVDYISPRGGRSHARRHWIADLLSVQYDNLEWFEPVDETPKRWQPEHDEKYYYVDSYPYQLGQDVDTMIWNGSRIDTACYELGNCFRTEQQAKAAAEAIKGVLAYMQAPYTDEQPAMTQAPRFGTDFILDVHKARAAVQESGDA